MKKAQKISSSSSKRNSINRLINLKKKQTHFKNEVIINVTVKILNRKIEHLKEKCSSNEEQDTFGSSLHVHVRGKQSSLIRFRLDKLNKLFLFGWVNLNKSKSNFRSLRRRAGRRKSIVRDDGTKHWPNVYDRLKEKKNKANTCLLNLLKIHNLRNWRAGA